MNYEQKMAAFIALCDTSVRMRKPRDWYIDCDVSVKDSSVLIGMYGNGDTPEAAIENHWFQLCENLKPSQYLVTRRGDKRHAVRWNGFMWQEVTE